MNQYLEKIASRKQIPAHIRRGYHKVKDSAASNMVEKAINPPKEKKERKKRTRVKLLEKAALLMSKPKEKTETEKRPAEKEHVVRALKKLEKEDGVLLDHSMGSGKTRLFLLAVEKAQAQNPDSKKRSLIVAPASLVTNIDKEVKKHNLKIDLSKVDALSYEKAVIDANKLRKNKYLIAIADEGHKLSNTKTQRHSELSDIFKDADKRVIASATPSYNKVSDISPLVNLVAGRNVLPEGAKQFEDEFVNTGKEPVPLLRKLLGSKPQEKHNLKNTKVLSKILSKYVDHYDLEKDPKMAKHFPTMEEKVVRVEMSPTQAGVYKYYEDELPWRLKVRVRAGLPIDKQDSKALNMYSMAIRQASDSVQPFLPQFEEVSPKIMTAVDNLEKEHKKNPDYKGLVYSNFKTAGLEQYSKELTRRGIEHSIYHGGLSKDQKDKIIDAHNAAKKNVLLVTSSGGEGISLKGTRQVQLLEGHFNKSKLDQLVGRARRIYSHDHLPEKDRHVKVEYYHSVFKKNKLGMSSGYSIDEYLHHHAKTKDDVSQQLRELITNK